MVVRVVCFWKVDHLGSRPEKSEKDENRSKAIVQSDKKGSKKGRKKGGTEKGGKLAKKRKKKGDIHHLTPRNRFR